MAQQEDAMEIPESDDVAFDDLLLVKAYDHAIGAACNSDIEKLLSVKHSGTDSTPALNKPSPSSTQNQPKGSWKPGMPVSALYSEDQKYYEANILKIFDDSCLVKFVGYNNKEKVPFAHIRASLGKAAQQKQIAEAAAELADISEQDQNQSSEDETDEMNECDSSRPCFGTKANSSQSSLFNFEAGQSMIPPPIPPHVMKHFPQSESELLSSMLLSWYMSGYHTGYWQGFQASKSQSTAGGRNRLRKK